MILVVAITPVFKTGVKQSDTLFSVCCGTTCTFERDSRRSCGVCLKWRKVPSDEDSFKRSMLDSMTCEEKEEEWDSSDEVECTDGSISENKKRTMAATDGNAKGRT